jgi:hypothetical protein
MYKQYALKWSAVDLARHCALGVNTIRRAEVAEANSPTAASEMAIRRTFEPAGVEFIEENGGGQAFACESTRRKRARLMTGPNGFVQPCEARNGRQPLAPRLPAPGLRRSRPQSVAIAKG